MQMRTIVTRRISNGRKKFGGQKLFAGQSCPSTSPCQVIFSNNEKTPAVSGSIGEIQIELSPYPSQESQMDFVGFVACPEPAEGWTERRNWFKSSTGAV